jgi:hypothetical protein
MYQAEVRSRVSQYALDLLQLNLNVKGDVSLTYNVQANIIFRFCDAKIPNSIANLELRASSAPQKAKTIKQQNKYNFFMVLHSSCCSSTLHSHSFSLYPL